MDIVKAGIISGLALFVFGVSILAVAIVGFCVCAFCYEKFDGMVSSVPK